MGKLAMTNKTANGLDRRSFLATSLVAGAFAAMSEPLAAQTSGKKTFTILHTNDLHSNLIGMAPAADYTPLTLNDDNTWGGFARLATTIRERKAATEGLGPVLVLDAGDFSMGTAFAAATRETGAELRLLAILGFDATTFGNYDFNLGPEGTAASINAAVDAGQVPVILAANTDLSAQAETLGSAAQRRTSPWAGPSRSSRSSSRSRCIAGNKTHLNYLNERGAPFNPKSILAMLR
jgi:5'-nucleotidase